MLTQGVDWNVFFPLAIEHGVSSLVAARLQQSNCDAVPPDWREKLQSRMRAQHLFTLSMTAELFRILDAFSKSHIETLLVKGPIVSLLAYGDAAMRSYVDLDLLVCHHDILSAAQQMLALGFQPAFPLAAIHAGKIPGEYLFRRPGTQRIIELHTERSFRYYPVPLPLADFFARQRFLAVDGRDVPVLSLEDEFVLNCIHGAKHFWERLIWLADIAAMVSRHPELDWQRAKQNAEDVGALRMLYLALQLSESLLGVTVPAPIVDGVAADAPVRSLCMQVAAGICTACPAGACRISHEHAWGRNCRCGLPAPAVAFAHGRRLAEGCGRWALVALGRSLKAFAPHPEVWTGPLSSAYLYYCGVPNEKPARRITSRLLGA